VKSTHCGGFNVKSTHCGGFTAKIYALRRFHCKIYALRRFHSQIYALRRFQREIYAQTTSARLFRCTPRVMRAAFPITVFVCVWSTLCFSECTLAA
jgi:hypothetical protein